MEQLWNALHQRLNGLSLIPSEEWQAFRALSTCHSVSKGSHWVRAGEHTDKLGICVNGLFRLYYTTPDGKEFNKSFCAKLDFVASYSSLLLESPAYFSIQALMDSALILIRFRDFESLYARHICWERLGRLLAEQLYIKKETRERELLLLSAETRYLFFIEQYGHLMHHIPQYHIASYLGITPVALSRIRSKLT